MPLNIQISTGDIRTIHLPDGSRLTVDLGTPGEAWITHWPDGLPLEGTPGKTMHLILKPQP